MPASGVAERVSPFSVAARAFDQPLDVAAPVEWATPLDLAAALNPFTTVRTPALELVNAAVVECLSTKGGRLIVSMPPQEGKSSAVTAPAPLWMQIRDPDTRVAIACYSTDLAEDFGGQIRSWITTFDGTDDEIDLGLRVAKDFGAKRRWKIAGRMGGLIAIGIGAGTFTGRPSDALFIDDPFGKQADADSPAYRELVWKFWTGTCVPRVGDQAPVVLIQTRWHEDDLAGRLQAAPDGSRWRVVNIPAVADHDPDKGQTDPLGRQPGEWMRSARGPRSDGEWESIRVAAGPRGFSALYQGKPAPASGQVWLREWWRSYERIPWTSDGSERRVDGFDELIQSWDMAFKDTKGSDFVVGGVLGRRGAQVWLLDEVRDRMTFTQTLRAFRALSARWPQATAKLVEDKANGTAVIDTLRDEIGGIIPITPHESKYARAVAVSPFIEAGNVLLPGDKLDVGFDPQLLVEEAAAFPNAAHDDQVDMLSQGLARLLLSGTGAAEWIDYLRRRAAAQDEPPAQPEPAAPAATDARQAARQAAFAKRSR